MNVLSLFDGMSCGQIALERSGIKTGFYFASEIDNHCIKVTQKNYPRTIQLGNIEAWRTWPLDWSRIDLVFGGSPCQGFSFAGKQLAFHDPRSKLFFMFVDILDHVRKANPNVKFLLENVRMKKEFRDLITDFIGTDPIEINSTLVSAQNRRRLYWTNIGDIAQPKDQGICLRDIIVDGFVDREKAYCLDASYFKGGDLVRYFEKHRKQIVFNDICVFREQGRRLAPDGTKRDDKNGRIIRGYEFVSAIKANTLSTVLKDNHLKVRDVFRNLYPMECERLQTVPDDYTAGVSNTQRYKMLGNGWTVDVIVHILSYIELNPSVSVLTDATGEYV